MTPYNINLRVACYFLQHSNNPGSMKYNLDDLHWQEFEVLAFKILQILIAQDVQFLEGGNDKGRDIVYAGKSDFNTSYSGKWIFQAKHKSKLNIEDELASTLVSDLKYGKYPR